jgi:hypothetical protein
MIIRYQSSFRPRGKEGSAIPQLRQHRHAFAFGFGEPSLANARQAQSGPAADGADTWGRPSQEIRVRLAGCNPSPIGCFHLYPSPSYCHCEPEWFWGAASGVHGPGWARAQSIPLATCTPHHHHHHRPQQQKRPSSGTVEENGGCTTQGMLMVTVVEVMGTLWMDGWSGGTVVDHATR